MKIPKRFTPKRLFRSRKSNRSDVSRSDPPSFNSATSSSSSAAAGSATPTSVLPDSTESDALVSRKELQAILSRIASQDEVATMLGELGGGRDGFIRLEAVLDRVGSGLDSPIESELRDTFEFFDADHDGRITAEELHGAFESMGDEGCTLADCRRMIADVDENGDGFVCFGEFVRMMELQR